MAKAHKDDFAVPETTFVAVEGQWKISLDPDARHQLSRAVGRFARLAKEREATKQAHKRLEQAVGHFEKGIAALWEIRNHPITRGLTPKKSIQLLKPISLPYGQRLKELVREGRPQAGFELESFQWSVHGILRRILSDEYIIALHKNGVSSREIIRSLGSAKHFLGSLPPNRTAPIKRFHSTCDTLLSAACRRIPSLATRRARWEKTRRRMKVGHP
jgi:hypothetical protein